MRSTLDGLGYKDKQLLAQFVDNETYKALRKLIDIERIELAKDAIDQVDMLQVRHLSGQAYGLKRLIGTLRSLLKEQEKNDKLKKKS